ncbi:flagellar assembly protein FliW [Bacillus massiliglaciei]|uniref:flagellar assembly protein FliW n=1 Tax=Bacillus massiliglaciei TaxID=1816693 RepID=UPI000A965CE9|nr:flagellar assembly protein FliW [Bacillus massiliglaciei]
MEIQTKFHGPVSVAENEIYTFEKGIPGFIDETSFCLLPIEETPFWVLQSVQTKELGFIVVNPFENFPEYEVKLSDEAQTALQIGSEQEVWVFAILTVREPFSQTTVNLKAPLVLNNEKKLGKQFIMNDALYETKQLLLQPLTVREAR